MICISHCKHLLLASMIICAASTAYAQTDANANDAETKHPMELSGHVTGKQGEPLIGVVVQVLSLIHISEPTRP